jgi:hypothetical protein
VHELPRGGFMPCQERDFWEMGPGACEGGGGREILNAAPLGVNAIAPPRWPLGRKTGRTLCHKRSTISALAGRFDDHALRHESRFPRPEWTDRPVFRIAWGDLCSPARSGRAFLSRNCGRMTSMDRKKVTQFVVALPGSDNETERATPCPVPRRPPRAVKAAMRRSRDGLRPA